MPVQKDVSIDRFEVFDCATFADYAQNVAAWRKKFYS